MEIKFIFQDKALYFVYPAALNPVKIKKKCEI
jgi:hypothetical protein